MKRLLAILLMATGILFNSCATDQHTSNYQYTSNSKFKSKYLNIKCYETINNTSDFSSCLAKDYDYNHYYIVNFTCPGKAKYEVYYDGKSISGNYIFVGTYITYLHRTVQAYMPTDNFYEIYNYDKQYLKELLDIILSYNIIE